MADDKKLKARTRKLLWFRVLVIGGAVLAVALTIAALIYGSNHPGQKAATDSLTVFLSALGGALWSVALGQIWWETVTRDQTQSSLADAVSDVFVQQPKFVGDYIQDEKIVEFIRNNVEARTDDPALAEAITYDLVRPFIETDPTLRSRIRTKQTYEVALRFQDEDGGVATDRRHALWDVKERLAFEERNGAELRVDSTVAVFVFCEEALSEWWASRECMYRSVAYMPESVKAASLDERRAWVDKHLGCVISVEGETLDVHMQCELGAAEKEWVVKYRVGPGEAARINALRQEAQTAAEAGSPPSINVVIDAETTQSPRLNYYTAYLAYPTLSPVIEFDIVGPILRLECASFYSRSAPRAGSKTVDDVNVVTEPAESDPPRRMTVSLDTKRWVFPMSGVSFIWVMED